MAGSDYDTVIDTYQWTDPLGAFAPFGCDDTVARAPTSRLVMDILAGQVIGVRVSSPSGQPGGQSSLANSVVPPPANDDSDAATAVGPLRSLMRSMPGTSTTGADDLMSTSAAWPTAVRVHALYRRPIPGFDRGERLR